MTTPVLLALTGASLESAVITALQRSGTPGVHIVRRCVDVADLQAAAATGAARAALVAPDLPHLDIDVIALLRAAGVEPMGVVAGEAPDQEHRLHQMGIRVVLRADRSDDLAADVEAGLRARAQPAPGSEVATAGAADVHDGPAADGADGASGGGTVVAVWGPAGAPGRTTVATGLAAELAALGEPTLLVDADVYGGAVAQHLALLDDVSGLLAAARNARVGTLGPAALAIHARSVGDLRVLTGLPRPDRWPELSAAATAAVLTAGRALCSHVVVDCGFSLETEEELMFDTAAPRRNGATLCVLEQADRVLAVGAADPVGLSRLARGVVDLVAAVPGCEPALVVNRMRGSLGWATGDVRAALGRFTGRAPLAVLPDDRAACDRALVQGRMLRECTPGSPLRAGLRDLAAWVTGVPPSGRGRRRPARAVP